MMTPIPALIGIDWGSSNLRAWIIDAAGRIVDRRADPRGAAGLQPESFADVLQAVCGDWLTTGAPALVCGMAGSRQGWSEAPYRDCPVSRDTLATALIRPPGSTNVFLVPGVALRRDGQLTDVMRGEEVQAVGVFNIGEDGRLVAPGTHSKWIDVRQGRIESFRTYMTGELFAAIRTSTLLGAGMGEAGGDDAAFERGVRRALADPAVTALLFSVRVEGLDGRLAPGAAADYLSGLLIGAEIAAQKDRTDPVVIVGAEPLARRYRQALAIAGQADARIADAEATTALGLWRLWKARK